MRSETQVLSPRFWTVELSPRLTAPFPLLTIALVALAAFFLSPAAARAQPIHGVDFSPWQLTITEGGSATFSVSLRTRPTATVEVVVGYAWPVGSPFSYDVLSFSPASLTFTPDTWSQGQTVTVSIPQNDQVDGDRTWYVWCDPVDTGLNETDSNYSGESRDGVGKGKTTPWPLVVKVVDDDG